MEAVILARGLVKEYDGKQAVKEINFEVRPQECFGLLGPNGAGKTSTVKMIYCFSPVTAGSLAVLGLDVRKKPGEIKRKLGVVAQENNLDLDLTVLENLLVYAGFFGLGHRAVLPRVLDLLEFFGLSEQRGDKVETLSGGMKRRLIIARALVNSPEVLILDEPTTGLDPQARHLVWQRLRRLKQQGVTLLLTTHYMDEAAQLCDRLVIIDSGKILAEGHPRDLVADQVGEQVLEIGRGSEIEADILKAGKGLIKDRMTVGDALFVFPADGQALLEVLRPVARRFSYHVLRPATLEDVFLKLTGRGLAE